MAAFSGFVLHSALARSAICSRSLLAWATISSAFRRACSADRSAWTCSRRARFGLARSVPRSAGFRLGNLVGLHLKLDTHAILFGVGAFQRPDLVIRFAQLLD